MTQPPIQQDQFTIDRQARPEAGSTDLGFEVSKPRGVVCWNEFWHWKLVTESALPFITVRLYLDCAASRTPIGSGHLILLKSECFANLHTLFWGCIFTQQNLRLKINTTQGDAAMSACDGKQNQLTEHANKLVARLANDSKELAADIQQKAKDIDPGIDTSGPDVWVGLDIDVSWKRTDISLDLPEVKIVDQRWVIDLPQVTMKDQSIIFHTPSIRMETQKTGEYPETRCTMVTKDIGLGVKIDVPECTVWWSPIYIDVPVPFMQEHTIIMGIPELGFRAQTGGICPVSLNPFTIPIRSQPKWPPNQSACPCHGMRNARGNAGAATPLAKCA